jgi:hypothetical protein
MPQREFANQKALVAYAEQNDLAYEYEYTPAHHAVNGLGCRGNAAEIKPIEPVWVIPAKEAAGCQTASHSMRASSTSPSSAPE